ncbi:unnamed protein product, partial [Choristocarpus tenellus]
EEAGEGELGGGISAYEKQRQERILRNQAFLAGLGLGDVKPTLPFMASSGGRGKSNELKRARGKSVSHVKDPVPVHVVRRSRRARTQDVCYSEVCVFISFN